MSDVWKRCNDHPVESQPLPGHAKRAPRVDEMLQDIIENNAIEIVGRQYVGHLLDWAVNDAIQSLGCLRSGWGRLYPPHLRAAPLYRGAEFAGAAADVKKSLR